MKKETLTHQEVKKNVEGFVEDLKDKKEETLKDIAVNGKASMFDRFLKKGEDGPASL